MIANDQATGRGDRSEAEPGSGVDAAKFEPPQVVGQARHAMRVNPAQTGRDQRVHHQGRVAGPQTYRSERTPPEGGE